MARPSNSLQQALHLMSTSSIRISSCYAPATGKWNFSYFISLLILSSVVQYIYTTSQNPNLDNYKPRTNIVEITNQRVLPIQILILTAANCWNANTNLYKEVSGNNKLSNKISRIFSRMPIEIGTKLTLLWIIVSEQALENLHKPHTGSGDLQNIEK